MINPFKTMKKLKGVFKPLKCYFYLGKNHWHITNHCYCPSVFIKTCDVGWKDKYDTPRYEHPPYIWIHLFKWNIILYWSLPSHKIQETNQYWEQALWYLYYYNNISYGCNEPNVEKAKESWPWEDYKTGKSTWSNEFLIK